MGLIVGRIIEVKGLTAKAQIDKLLPPYLINNGKIENAPKINGYVKTKVGLDTIICQVTGEYSKEINGEINGLYIELSVKGHFENKKFIQGLRMLPIVSATIELLDEKDYKILYSHVEHSLDLGKDLFDFTKRVMINSNSLIPSHIGIFGNTGSGKSNTLVKILHEYEKKIDPSKTKKAKIILFDLNNEYSANSICSLENKTIYNLKTRNDSGDKIPLNFNKLNEDNVIVLLNASEKTQVPAIKLAYKHAFAKEEERRDKSYYIENLKSLIKNGKRQLFYSMRHNLKEYISNIENFIFHSNIGSFYYKDGTSKIYIDNSYFDFYLDKIDIKIPEKQLERFLFELYFSVAYLDETSLDFLTVMAPGECIISGTSIQMPTFTYIDQVECDTRPKSENVILFGENGLITE